MTIEDTILESNERVNSRAFEIAGDDVGEIYQRVHGATRSDLEAIKRAGVFLGHSGIVERVYEVLNYEQLEKAGADETDLLDFNTALVCNDNETIEEICNDNKVELLTPNNFELAHMLYNAVYNYQEFSRGYSIDNLGTSVGYAYQKLFGNDFNEFSFGASRHDGEVVRVPYSEIPAEHKDMIHKMIIDAKLKDLGFKLPEKKNGNGDAE
ncbi:Uncharacterised protein [uncultured archaeon]|nr:Uncharacterised protein [uncultured archaeon]